MTAAAAPAPPDVDHDHPLGDCSLLVDPAVRLVHAIREQNGRDAAIALLRQVPDELIWDLAVTIAALVPSDVDPEHALEWIDVPSKDWSDATVAREHGRWTAGARDHVAGKGHGQHLRRRADAHHAQNRTPA